MFLSHGHPDHCADLNPLLRARHLSEAPAPPLPVFAPTGAADAVLALDGQMLDDAYVLSEFSAGEDFTVGPFHLLTRSFAHFVPNVGVRVTAGDAEIVYTGDGGADPGAVDLAAGARLLLAEATFVDGVPEHSRGLLADAVLAGKHAAAAEVGKLALTHLWPNLDHAAAVQAARQAFDGPIMVAVRGPEFLVG